MFVLYFILAFFFAFPFLLVAVALGSWHWFVVAALSSVIGSVWFSSVAFAKMLSSRHAVALNDERMNGVLERAVQKINATSSKKFTFRFWMLSESEAECLLWIRGSEMNIFITQGMFARASEEQIHALLHSMIIGDLRQVRLENRLYALSLWWLELKGQKSQFRYWFISFWLYPLERVLKIAKM